MSLKKIAIGLLCSLTVVSTHAVPTWHWSLDVEFIISGIGGTVQVMFFKDGTSYKPCNNIEYYTYKYDGDNSVGDKGRDVMTSSLLTAYAADKKVSAIINCVDNTLHGVRLDTGG